MRMFVRERRNLKTPNKVFNLTYLGVTVLACATTAPPKTQVKTALDGPFGRMFWNALKERPWAARFLRVL